MFNFIFHANPSRYGAAFILSIPIFGFVYWLTPSALPNTSFIDSLYFSVITITTLGYGDITPQTNIGKLIAGTQAVLGVCLMGLFLNALAERRDIQLARSRSDESKELLEINIALLIEAIESGNPFIWDKHAIHAKKFEEMVQYAKVLKAGVRNGKYKLHQLEIKALIETARQNYNTFVGLIPVAASISPFVGGQWISLVSNVKNLGDRYDHVTVREDGSLGWPTQDEVAIQIDELISTSFIICGISED